MCEEGKFRWDLYYRLAVVDLRLPNLQERGQKELKELLQYFIRVKKEDYFKKYTLDIPPGVWQKILSYPFPDNIRELENLIERLYVINVRFDAHSCCNQLIIKWKHFLQMLVARYWILVGL